MLFLVSLVLDFRFIIFLTVMVGQGGGAPGADPNVRGPRFRHQWDAPPVRRNLYCDTNWCHLAS